MHLSQSTFSILWPDKAHLWCLGLLIALGAPAAKHRVDPGAPLQEAVDRLQPGDQLVFGPGEYRDSFILRTSDVSLHGQGAIFSGLQDIEPNWQATGKAFKSKVNHPVRQLFSGTDMLIPARWPNRKFSRGDGFFADMWDNDTWCCPVCWSAAAGASSTSAPDLEPSATPST